MFVAVIGLLEFCNVKMCCKFHSSCTAFCVSYKNVRSIRLSHILWMCCIAVICVWWDVLACWQFLSSVLSQIFSYWRLVLLVHCLLISSEVGYFLNSRAYCLLWIGQLLTDARCGNWRYGMNNKLFWCTFLQQLVDEEKLRSSGWFPLVGISAVWFFIGGLTLLIEQQEVHMAAKKPAEVMPKCALFCGTWQNLE